jgi:hypothetical protein
MELGVPSFAARTMPLDLHVLDTLQLALPQTDDARRASRQQEIGKVNGNSAIFCCLPNFQSLFTFLASGKLRMVSIDFVHNGKAVDTSNSIANDISIFKLPNGDPNRIRA